MKCIFIHQIFMAKTKGIFMGSTYEDTIKKAMKIMKNSQLMAHEQSRL